MEMPSFFSLEELNICEFSAFLLDNRKKCNYSMKHSKGMEEEEYAVITDREECSKAGRYSQKEAAEGSFGAGKLMVEKRVLQQVSTYSCVKGE